MNDKNIQNIIEYFSQNPSQKPEDLVQTLLTSGYPRIDIDEALNRIGISPEVMPEEEISTVPQQPSSNTHPHLPVKKLLLIAGLLMLLGGLLYASRLIISFYQSQNRNTGAIPDITPQASVPTPTRIPLADPSEPMKEILSNGIYRIHIQQFIFDADPQQTEESTLTYYIQNGIVLRVEHSGGTTFIIQNENVYVLDTNTKTYSTYAASPDQKQQLWATVQQADVISNFLEKTEKGVYSWQKIDDFSWQGINQETDHTFNIKLNKENRLLERVEEYDETKIKVSESILTIQPTTLVKEILEVPPDYRGVEFEIQ